MSTEPTEAARKLAAEIRCTPGQASGYLRSLDESALLIDAHVAERVTESNARNLLLADAINRMSETNAQLRAELATLREDKARALAIADQHLKTVESLPAEGYDCEESRQLAEHRSFIDSARAKEKTT